MCIQQGGQEIEALKLKLLEASPVEAREWLTKNRIPEHVVLYGGLLLGIYPKFDHPFFRTNEGIELKMDELAEAWKDLVSVEVHMPCPQHRIGPVYVEVRLTCVI